MRSLLAVPLALALGCAHPQTKAVRAPIAPHPPPVASATPRASLAEEPAGSCSNDTECGEAQLCVGGRCVEASAGLPECSHLRIRFPLDSEELDPAATASLLRSARCLRADHALHVTIEGDADERGTEEYNMALGDRRANAVASYLEALGASKAQLRTVSYGKERPLCTEHDEACWSRNRRAELNVAGAGGKKRDSH